jgi:arylsulfatase A-like enzyme
MNRIQFALCLLLMFVITSVAGADTPRPNVVYFLVDDMGREDCGFMGGREIKTPQIDKLAAAGTKFDTFYVQPVCSPTRAALLTGRYPMRQGLQVGVVLPWAQYGLPLEERTIADDLKAAGYVTGIFGKWHLGHFQPEYLPMHRGFMHHYGHYLGALDYFTHERDGGFDWHKDGKTCHDKGYTTTLISEHAAEFVGENAGKNPFFLYVPFNAVHAPFEPPKDGIKAYPNLKGDRQSYAAMLTATDDAIAKIVAAVEKAGIRDNTLFIFSSDNGGPSPGTITDNGKYRGGKGGLYEGGVRVAAFATWDGHIPSGATVTEPMHAIDWRPTLEKLCSAPQQGNLPMDGRDIWPTITRGAPSPHDVILLNTTPKNGAVRSGDWKLIVNQGDTQSKQAGAERRAGEAVQLFNLRSDPFEKSNLAAENPAKLKSLQKMLNNFANQAIPPKTRPRPASFQSPAVWGEAGG